MFTTLLLLALGLVLLSFGADLLVRGASAIASRLGMPPLIIGLTVVAFATSAPELVASVKASLAGQGDIAMGNVIGSNIFNVAIILGFSALIFPLAVHLNILRFDMPVMLGVSALFTVFLLSGGGLAQWEGSLLLAGLAVYLTWSVLLAKKEPTAPEILSVKTSGLPLNITLVILGLAMLIGGGHLFVESAVTVARALGWSEAIIGLTVVAAGTSLPELATSVVAALRRQTDIAIGNIVGSNIFNLLGIAGIASLARPVSALGINWLDLGTMLFTSALLIPLMRTGYKILRWEGGVMLVCFCTYLWLRWPS
ncbi:calcium/sodium antiporter [Akkermansiaceae bacterium]|nr:calcium/sodium antiporter [Akkermansiaceae bacterium]